MSCVAVNCASRTTIGGVRQPNISFHKYVNSFPKCPEIRNAWIKAIGRENWEPNKYSRLCSKHFEESCFISGLQLQKLKTEAVPSIFKISQELSKKKSSSLKKRRRRQPTRETRLPIMTQAQIPDNRTIIFRVYRYMQNEYFYLRDHIGFTFDLDLTPLANILERTAEATGVSEQVITSILEEKQAEWSDTDSAPETHTFLTELTKSDGSSPGKKHRKRSCKVRYNKRERAKLKRRGSARSKFTQNLQTIAEPSKSSCETRTEPNNKEVSGDNSEDLSRLEDTQATSEQGDMQLNEDEYKLISIKVEAEEERIVDRLGHLVDTSTSDQVNHESIEEVFRLQSGSPHHSIPNLSDDAEAEWELSDGHNYHMSCLLSSIPEMTKYCKVRHLIHDHSYCLWYSDARFGSSKTKETRDCH